MNCRYCKETCKKAGKQKSGIQKWKCKRCGKYQQESYVYQGCNSHINQKIVALLKEGCGIRSISRLLSISCTTVIQKIKVISEKVSIPPIKFRKEYEVDEMRTFVQKKTRLFWVAYAIQKDTKEVVAFNMGRSQLHLKSGYGYLTAFQRKESLYRSVKLLSNTHQQKSSPY